MEKSVPCLWLTMPWVLGLVLKVWQFHVISLRRCICKNSLTKQHFRAESWISEQKFAQRFVTKTKGQNSYAERKTGECFQRKTVGSCSRRDTCSFSTHTCQVNRETVWKEVGDARRSRSEQASSSVPKVKTQTDVKSSNSLKASLATRFKKSLVYGRQDEKDRHVIIGIIPCVVVSNLETFAFVAFVAYIDMLMVRSNLSARSRKEGTQGAVAILRGEKSKVVYLKTQMQWILFYGKLENWYEIQIRENKRAIWRHYPQRWTSRAKSLRNLTTSRLWQQSSVEFGEKNAQCWAREIEAQIKWILCGEDPKIIWRYWPWMGKCKINEDARVFLFMISICS